MKLYHLSNPVYAPPTGLIDHDKGIIRGITVARVGAAKGHNGFIDKTFLLQLVDLAASRPQGVKARFGHPNMCATALGTYLGRFHNYAYHADKVSADLHLDESAKNTPNGNLFEYVLNMAKSSPDMFGASLVFEKAEFEKKQQLLDGKQTAVNCFRLKELRATDIVDDPAASDGLFSAESIPGQATQWLNQNPEMAELIFSKPENLIEFLNNYLNNAPMNFSENVKSKFQKLFSLDNIADNEPPLPPEPEEKTKELNIQNTFQTEVFSRFLSLFPQLGITKAEDDTFIFSNESETHVLQPEEISETLFTAIESLNGELSNAKKQISSLTDQLAARPTLPKDVTDPQVSTNLNVQGKDEAGKQLLQHIPAELRYRLRHLNKSST